MRRKTLCSCGAPGLLVVAGLFNLSLPVVAAETDTAAFRQQLIEDLQTGVSHARQVTAAERAAGIKPKDYYVPYLLWASIHLHGQTGDDHYLANAKEDLLWIVRAARDEQGHPRAFFTDFRFLAPFCDAWNYLAQHGRLTAGEIGEIQAQLQRVMADRLAITDYGPHNRAMIRGGELLLAARALPDAPAAGRWQRHGEALVYDSFHGWPIEDASIYQPFWLNYALTLAETQGTLDAWMQRSTTRFQFESMKQLLLPNGFMPEWGDGEWSQSWMWYFADFVRAGSTYRDGEYLEAARRLYTASVAFKGLQSPEALGAVSLGLRWLDASVPLWPLDQRQSHEVVDDLVAKKIVFRSPGGGYLFLNYRDQGPFARAARSYLDAQLSAHEEKPHHGHADENAINLLMDAGTVLLADGGYRRTFIDGWRADVFHNRLVARTGFPLTADIIDYLHADTAYHDVQTEKVHFGTFGTLDYSRTRLIDDERGYTADRIILFVPENALTIVVDSVLIDRPGHKVFASVWHPENVLQQGDNYVVSWPQSINDRAASWTNPHERDLLIQFLDNRDKVTAVRAVDRRFRASQALYQVLKNYFFKGQRLTFITVLRPHSAGKFAPELLREVEVLKNQHDDGGTIGLQFTLGGERVTVGLKLDQTIGLTNLRGRPMFDATTGAVDYGALRTDADFAYVRERDDGGREFGFINAIRVTHAGRPLFEMPPNHEMFQGAGDFRVADVRDKMPRWHQVLEGASQP